MIKTCILFLSLSLLVSAQSGMSACTAGRMTYYNYGSDGGCSFGSLTGATGPGNVYVVAPNEAYFNNAAQCGICYEVTGKKGTVTVMVADYCPVSGNEQWCSGDITHFDMNQPAFDAAGILSDGVESMKFRQVSCPVSGNLGLHLKDGSSIYWFGILVYNHRVGVSSVEVQPSGSSQWTTLARQNYNYFLWTTGTMKLPMKVRLTGVTGEQLITTVSSIDSDVLVPTTVQFASPSAGYTGSASVGCGSNSSNSATTGSNTVTTGSNAATSGSNTATTGSNAATTGSGIDIGVDIFTNGLISGWQDWSWDCTNSWTDAGVDAGTVCLTSRLQAWGGVQLASYPVSADTSSYSGISFYAKTDSGVYNQLNMGLNDGSSTIMITGITTTWQKYYVPFDDLGGNPGAIKTIMLQNYQTSSATLYFDKVTLVAQYGGGGVPWNPNAANMYATTEASSAAKNAIVGLVAVIVMIVALL